VRPDAIVALIRAQWTVLFNSGAIIAARLVTAVSGFVFWALATNTLSTDYVGFAITAQQSVFTIGSIGVLGLGTYLVSQLTLDAAGRSRAFSSTVAMVFAASCLFGAVYAIFAPLMVRALAYPACPGCMIATIAVCAGVTGVSLVVEELLSGLLLGGVSTVRAVVFALTRTATLWLFLGGANWRSPLAPLIAWAIGDLASALFVIPAIIKAGVRPGISDVSVAWIGAGLRPSLSHHALTLAVGISGYFLQMTAASVLNSYDNAMFGAAWVNSSFAFVLPFTLCSVLYASVIREPASFRSRLSQILLLGMLGSIVAIAVFWVAAPLLTERLGPSYLESATMPIRLFVLALPLVLMKGVWMTVQRLHNRMAWAARVLLLGGLLELGLPALAGWRMGLDGAVYGWFVSQLILGVLFAIPLLRAIRSPVTTLGIGQASSAVGASVVSSVSPLIDRKT
jgi:O-antigen/teichoic acid export membrane protein